MKELALEVPGNFKVTSEVGPVNNRFTDIGSLLTGIFPVILFVSGGLLVFWAFWGVFQYIFAGGNKEALAKARARITYAFIGFLVVALSFALVQYLQTVYKDVNDFNKLKTISTPSFIPTPKP